MALAKKGSRLITVDNQVFRWKVRGKPTYSQGNAWSSLTFAVELAERPMSTLVVEMSNAHPSNWLGAPYDIVTPSIVATSICQAIQKGWVPTQSGSAFTFTFSEQPSQDKP
jgi:hypothetical protein